MIRKKKRNKRLPRTASRPRLVSGCCLFGRLSHIPNVRVALALFAHGNLDFLRAHGIWHPLVRCRSRPRSRDDSTNLFLRLLVSDSDLFVACLDWEVHGVGFSWRRLQKMFPLRRMLGLTADTRSCQATETYEKFTVLQRGGGPRIPRSLSGAVHTWMTSTSPLCVSGSQRPVLYGFLDEFHEFFTRRGACSSCAMPG